MIFLLNFLYLLTIEIKKFGDMKPLLIIISLFLSHGLVLAQGIIAGDTTTAGIVYNDVPNVSIAASYPAGYTSYGLDMDEDGTDDLIFSSQVTSTMGSEFEVTRCVRNGQIQIGCFSTNPFWVNPFEIMEVIDPSSCWNEGGILKEYENNPDTTYNYGIFGSGYVGVKFLSGNQQRYGWVRIHATSGSVTIFDYAYQSIATGLFDQKVSESLSIMPNPVIDLLYIEIPSSKKIKNLNYRVFDIFSRKVIEGNLDVNNPVVECNELSPGYYFFDAVGEDFYSKPQKFLKE